MNKKTGSKLHHFIPDLELWWFEHQKEIWEIKPQHFQNTIIWEEKLHALQDWATVNGYNVQIIGEIELKHLEDFYANRSKS